MTEVLCGVMVVMGRWCDVAWCDGGVVWRIFVFKINTNLLLATTTILKLIQYLLAATFHLIHCGIYSFRFI